MIQLQLCYNTTTAVLQQIYIYTGMLLLLRYTVITLHYINFLCPLPYSTNHPQLKWLACATYQCFTYTHMYMWPNVWKPFQIAHLASDNFHYQLSPVTIIILMSHASATAKSSLFCFSCSSFLRHVRRAWVPGWLQMTLVAVHKQTLGCKLTHDY